MRKTIFGLVAMLGFGMSASAADLTVHLTDQDGKPLQHAVVSLTPRFAMTSMPDRVVRAEMRQEGTMFAPFVLPVSVDTTVSFPNFDEFRHQVYSFSKPKRFELRLYGQDESKTIHFDKPGVVALGCNIHDNMLAYVYVSAAPIVSASDESGVVALAGLEAGSYDIAYWHPDMPNSAAGANQTVTLDDGTPARVETALTLRSLRTVQQPPSDEEYN